MIALRLLLGKTGTSSSCTYETKSSEDHHDRLERLSPVPPSNEAEYKLQKALDENTLQRLLIDQLQSQLAAQSAYIQQHERGRQSELSALHDRVAQLELRLTDSQTQLAESVAAHTQAKAHVAALQHQRSQLVLELEQMEDGFQVELNKVSGELKSWERDMVTMDDPRPSKDSHRTSPSTSPSRTRTHTRTPSTTSSTSHAAANVAILTASLERAKSATRIWALEDEVDRVRHERDALRRRLDTGRANLMQLKRQASEVQGRLGRGRVNKSESNLKSDSSGRGVMKGMSGMGMQTRASDMQLNTRIRPAMRGEPLTPETSDDNRSIEMNM
ncbi:hypothetical protein FRC12_001724 [Ceratobasidium sp. 428]|nr:hypothetical protein FRC12_001724 [Ceratobasidium sp. 428]